MWCGTAWVQWNSAEGKLKCGMLCYSHGENAWDDSPAGGSCQHCSHFSRAVQACSSRAGSQLGTSCGLFHVQKFVLILACESLSVGGDLFAPFHKVPAPLKLGNWNAAAFYLCKLITSPGQKVKEFLKLLRQSSSCKLFGFLLFFFFFPPAFSHCPVSHFASNIIPVYFRRESRDRWALLPQDLYCISAGGCEAPVGREWALPESGPLCRPSTLEPY